MNQPKRFTSAHWGTYAATTGADSVELEPLASDPMPSRVGRGWVSAARDPAIRIARPSIRKGWLAGDNGKARCDDTYVEVPWDEALDMTSDALRTVIDTHGNDAIYAGSYGWASAGRFHHAQSQMRRFLNLIGGYVSSRDTYSHGAAEVLLPHLTGMDHKPLQEALTGWPMIAEHCALFLAFGGISARTAQIASGGTSTHETTDQLAKAAQNGMRTIAISPLRSDAETVPGAEWLPIRPGSDTALILALCHELFDNGWHDEEFLNRCTSGWEQFRDYVLGHTDNEPKTPTWAAPLCDIEEGAIRNLARDLSQERVMVSVTWGMQRADHGEQPLWGALALASLLGQIGQPGTGFAFGYGSTTPPGRSQRFYPWPSFPQGTNPVRDFIPVARIADMLLQPGEPYLYNGEERHYPDIKLVYWVGGNPFHHHQDLFRLEEAWRRPETVIVHDHSWTATARRADIVLPSTTPLEREDVMFNRRDERLVFMSRLIDPFGEARDDYAIFAGLAERFGLTDTFTEGRDTKGWLRWMWQGCEAVAEADGVTLPDFETFRHEGIFEVPAPEESRILFGDFVADPDAQPLKTESGKLTLFNERISAMGLNDCPGHPAWLEPEEWITGDNDMFHVIAHQPDTRLHGQLDSGSESKKSKVQGREVCMLHPEAAKRIGVRSGDLVKLHNDRGACLAAVGITDGIRTDCIVLPTGAWFDPQETEAGRLCVHGNPNVLAQDKGTSGLGQGCTGLLTMARLSKWDGALPDIKVHSAPRLESRKPAVAE